MLELALAVLAAASMWLYVNRVLRAYQIADAAAHHRPRGNLSDLYPRWWGSHELLLHGRDPYAADITQEIQAGYYGRPIDASRPDDPKDQQGFAYPIYVVFELAPTIKLPFAMVQQGFRWVLIALTASSVLVWFGALKWRVSGTTKVIWIVLTLGSFPAIQGFKLQQLTLLVAVLVAAAMYAVVRRHFVWAGILLALASIKPQLIILLALWLCIWVFGNWRERQLLFWTFAAFEAALIVAGEILLPGWIGKFRAASAAYYEYTGGGKSVLDVLLTPLWGRSLAIILLVATLVLLWRVRQAAEGTPDFLWSLSLVLAATVVVIPMFAPYNQLLLVPVVMVLGRNFPRLWPGHGVSKLLLLLTAIAMAWPWVAAAALVVALSFLPGPTVQNAWTLPLLTNFAIPVTVLALLLMGNAAIRSQNQDR